MKVFPYVYKVTNKQTNEFYIGYREANKLNPEMDILIYKTSNKFIKNNFDIFYPEIIAVFFTETAKKDAYWFEQYLIENNIQDSLCMNKYFFKNGKKQFKSRKGNSLSEESIAKMKISKNMIDPVSGLTSAQKAGLKFKETLKQIDPVTGLTLKEIMTLRAIESKQKNGSNTIGGRKSSITKNTIDPETGLTNAQKAGKKQSITKNMIDPETGLTNSKKSGIKTSVTKNTIDPETGLTNAQKAGNKLKETLKQIDPETGLTLKETQLIKCRETKRNNPMIEEKNPNAKHIQIYDELGNLRYDCIGTFVNVCKSENLSYYALTNSYKNNKPITDKKSQIFGWYAKLIPKNMGA